MKKILIATALISCFFSMNSFANSNDMGKILPGPALNSTAGNVNIISNYHGWVFISAFDGGTSPIYTYSPIRWGVYHTPFNKDNLLVQVTCYPGGPLLIPPSGYYLNGGTVTIPANACVTTKK